MNYLISDPVGIDYIIAEIQTKLYDTLSASWGVDLNGYPRCYYIKGVDKKTISHYVGKKEYKSLVHSEGNKFFFTAEKDETATTNGFYKTDIEIYFMVDLSLCKPSSLHRADNEVRIDVVNILDTISGIEVTHVMKRKDDIFNNVDFTLVTDVHPYHCFKIRCKVLEYELNTQYC